MGRIIAETLQHGTAVLWITSQLLWITYAECGELAHLFEKFKNAAPKYGGLFLFSPKYSFLKEITEISFFCPFFLHKIILL